MSYKYECEIIRDLFPSYVDKLTSKRTCEAVEEHVLECQDCASILSRMMSPAQDSTLTTANDSQVNPDSSCDQQDRINYLKKYKKKMSTLTKVILIISLVCVLAVCGSVFLLVHLWNQDSKNTVTDISQYSEVLGKDGLYKQNYIGYNDIFPDSLPKSAEVENFLYEYYNPWDANYLGYLVYQCNAADYAREYQRLKSLTSTDKPQVYGLNGFPYELCAVYSDPYYGIIYALADSENHRFIYVDLEFCNYFTDIDYTTIIDANHLPFGFDAKPHNPTRVAFDAKYE